MTIPLELVKQQFEAYNQHDLESFLTNFSETIKVYRMPAGEVSLNGKEALAQFYANERFNRPGLKAELLNRIVLDNKIFDHERIWGVAETPLEMVVVFEVKDGLIQTMWSFPA